MFAPVPLVWGLIGGLVLLIAIAAILLLQEANSRELEARIAAINADALAGARAAATPWLVGALRAIGQAIRERTRLYSEQDLASISAVIAASGLNPGQVLPLVLGAKVVVMVLVPVLAIGYGLLTHLAAGKLLMMAAGSLPAGVLGPDWVLKLLRGPYTRDLQRGASDALDLLVVCTEAGMALEPALDQVARELRSSNRAMATALTTLVDELKLLPDRRQAFINFGERSGVEGLRRMAAIINQALQHGTPLGQALRSIAAELRRERMTRLEAKAVRLPALLVFPLVAFILPALFIALMGSPMLHVMDALSRATGK